MRIYKADIILSDYFYTAVRGRQKGNPAGFFCLQKANRVTRVFGYGILTKMQTGFYQISDGFYQTPPKFTFSRYTLHQKKL